MKILVVDDDIVSRLALMDLLNHMSYQHFIECEDAMTAWKYLHENPAPIACCCDMRMPKMSGLDLLQKIRQDPRLEKLPFILITSGAERAVVEEAVSLAVTGYIVKPFRAEEAQQKLASILSKTLSQIGERPMDTANRLNISLQKLETYYNAFMQQVGQLQSKLNAAMDIQTGVNLDTVKTGCVTLGLWHAAKQIDDLNTFVGLKYSQAACLECVTQTLDRQLFLLRRDLNT
jgi:two-component system, chemotaxis family, chemotaxis protein CheY